MYRWSHNQHRYFSIFIGTCGLLLGLLGCTPQGYKRSKNDPVAATPSDQQFYIFKSDPFSGAKANNIRSLASESLKRMKTAKQMTSDQLWAISQCQCDLNTLGSELAKKSKTQGTLPQPLVPSVRNTIRNDPKLKALLGLPPGFIQNTANFFAGLFMGDDKITTMIQEGIAQKIDRATPGVANSGLMQIAPGFRFDGFLSNSFDLAQGSAAKLQSFNIDDQASRWAAVLGPDSMWVNINQFLYQNTHGLQVLETSRLVSEWQYLFGLESSDRGRVYGGLTFDPREGLSGQLAPFDPRTDVNAKRALSGNYTINYPAKVDQLDLAVQVQEQWTRASQAISLSEQAKLWWTGAKAFERLRPKNRTNIGKIFQKSDPLFPDEVHQISLIHLASMEMLLNEFFVDQENLLIFASAAQKDQIKNAELNRKADLLSLVRLARATSLWMSQTANLNDANLTPALRTKIENGRSSLEKLTQLSAQLIFAQHIRNAKEKSSIFVPSLVEDLQSQPMVPMKAAAETVASLIQLEQEVLKSPFLRSRIIGLSNWFVEEYWSKLDGSKNSGAIDPESIYWTHTMLIALEKYKLTASEIPWFTSLRSIVNNLVEAPAQGSIND